MKANDFTIRWLDSPKRWEVHAGHVVTKYNTDWHFHQDWQIVHVSAGERMFEWRDGGTTVGQGESLILPPTFVHRGRSSNESASFVMLYVSPGSMGIAAGHSPAMVRDPELTEVLAQPVSPSRVGEINRAIVSALFASGLHRPTSIPLAVLGAKAWLEAHHKCHNCFNKLGDIGRCNPYYMSRVFRRWTGLSPRAFRVQARLIDARRRISEGEVISRVAADLGFADQSHLGRQFKRAFVLAPGLYSCLSRPND